MYGVYTKQVFKTKYANEAKSISPVANRQRRAAWKGKEFFRGIRNATVNRPVSSLSPNGLTYIPITRIKTGNEAGNGALGALLRRVVEEEEEEEKEEEEKEEEEEEDVKRRVDGGDEYAGER
ncbi:hypothetical protein HZH68_016051 [Vespula germanica]|uniref:Uncharacterized protein n=1 Tax=Vespula germanica TaxID=30212 RepID=A0A834J4V2_VESGE|nr:hypothetical protein HZH68_016051 [Vespula germanica]